MPCTINYAKQIKAPIVPKCLTRLLRKYLQQKSQIVINTLVRTLTVKLSHKTLEEIFTAKSQIVINTLVRTLTVKLPHKTLEEIFTAKITNSY